MVETILVVPGIARDGYFKFVVMLKTNDIGVTTLTDLKGKFA